MTHEPVFGRRVSPVSSASSGTAAAAAADVRSLPSLQDLGFTPTDDTAEVRAFRRGFRWRLLAGMGIWRWLGAGAMCASFLSDHLGLSWMISATLSATGVVALLYGVRRAVRSIQPTPSPPASEHP